MTMTYKTLLTFMLITQMGLVMGNDMIIPFSEQESVDIFPPPPPDEEESIHSQLIDQNLFSTLLTEV